MWHWWFIWCVSSLSWEFSLLSKSHDGSPLMFDVPYLCRIQLISVWRTSPWRTSLIPEVRSMNCFMERVWSTRTRRAWLLKVEQTLNRMTVTYDRLVLADSICLLEPDRILEIHRHCRNFNTQALSYLGEIWGWLQVFLFINLNYVIQLLISGHWSVFGYPTLSGNRATGLDFPRWKRRRGRCNERDPIDRAAVEFDQVTFCLWKKASQFWRTFPSVSID